MTDIPSITLPDHGNGVNFTEPDCSQAWHAIDDRIMGGESRSRLRHDPAGYAVFEGTVSPDNGGGFASVRHAGLSLGAANAMAYRLEVLGDGKRYKLNLRTDQTFDGVNYQAVFQPPAGQWSTIELPVDAFVATFRGRPVSAPPLAPYRVSQVGLMIADRQWGPFALGLRSLVCVA
jgi:NADH dehydrogenase [ubiquinone] 1 alpha subcomplex assembly factor 1